jgi:hypothetical protein
MSKQTINIGASPNDGTGTPLRTSFDYTNQNFTELYTAVGPSGNNIVVPGNATITGDLTVDTSTLKVDSTNDRVGIGQATPAYKLHVQGNAGAQLVLQTNDTDATAKEGTVSARHYTNAEEPISTVGGFATSTNNYVYLGGGFSGGNAATFLGFHTAANNTTVTGTERYRIDSSGISIWSVAGTTAMTLNSTGLTVSAGATTPLDLTNAAVTTERQIKIENSSVTAYLGVEPAAGGRFVGSAAGNAYFGTNVAYGLEFATNNNVRMTLNTTGNLAFKDGLGIDFSAKTPDGSGTVGSEVLNDYEEGTFTPTVTSVGGTGIVYVASVDDSGRYTKIGRVVTFQVRLVGTYTGTFSYIRVALPFTATASQPNGVVSGYNNDTATALIGRTDNGVAWFIVANIQPSGNNTYYSGFITS